MDLKIVISADDSALEFSRNLGKLIGQYISQADIEAGLAGKVITATIEPGTMPWEDEVEKGRQYADQAQKAAEAEAAAQTAIEQHEKAKAEVPESARNLPEISPEDLRKKGIEFSRTQGKDAMRMILEKLNVTKMSDLDAAGRALASQMIDEVSHA